MLLGPVPKLFSNEPQKTLEELKKLPQFAFDCLQALVARLLERGELSRYKKLGLHNKVIPT